METGRLRRSKSSQKAVNIELNVAFLLLAIPCEKLQKGADSHLNPQTLAGRGGSSPLWAP